MFYTAVNSLSVHVSASCHSCTSSLLPPPHAQVRLPARRLCCLWMTSTCPNWTPTAHSPPLSYCDSTWSVLLMHHTRHMDHSSCINHSPHVQCGMYVCESIVKLAMVVVCGLPTVQDFGGLYDRDKLFWKTVQVQTIGTLCSYNAPTLHSTH